MTVMLLLKHLNFIKKVMGIHNLRKEYSLEVCYSLTIIHHYVQECAY